MQLIAIAVTVVSLQGSSMDTTVHAPVGTRLEVTADAGRIEVDTWDRPDVRIKGMSGRVAVVLDGAVLRVSTARSTRMEPVALKITVPRRMDLTLGRGDVDIIVTSSEGEISATNYRGAIDISGGRRMIRVRSIKGDVSVRDADANVDAYASEGSLSVTNVTGNVQVEATAKHITLDRVNSRNLSAKSVGGVIKFTGPVHGDGRYSLTTHMGSIWLNATNAIDATVSVATVTGGFSTRLSHRIASRAREGIFTAVFGSGRAQVELESYEGGIVVQTVGKM